MNKAQITVQQILQAALAVAAEKGPGKVTLDAVAQASGLSKGGLLYHFPSKEALLSAMVQFLVDDAEHSRQQFVATESSKLAAFLKARECFTQQLSSNTAMAILAAAAEQPALLKPLQQHNRKVFNDILAEHHHSPEVMSLLLVSEALTFHQLLNISPLTPEQHSQLENYMTIRAQELR
ncbi:TetR/AcrR family transcriptional regulator [Alishewanella sp. 16-MA]|uniref:TetR/AcrR family transcriptional regulator n=1 Tax=Alishewanella maricola TaxID=2795740 RepID=A0ABS8C1T7_9ALTE|nr:TetR/AcrR family transcriptional regulator [Alishewanella maricola]